VTAEYYGEVIASLDEARLNIIENEEISYNAGILYEELISALENLRDFENLPVPERDAVYRESAQIRNWRRIIRNTVKRSNIQDKMNYHNLLDGLVINPLFDDLMEFIWREESGRNRNIRWDLSPKNRDEALFYLYSDLNKKAEGKLNEAAFMNFYYQNKTANLSRVESRKSLTMIGRGWVKAGFDFSNLTPNSIIMYEELGEVHIMGLSPKILNADINPWFIPERGVPGFEILDENGRVNFHDAKRVKQYCVSKLLEQANRANILSNSERQAEETLSSLFSLITGKEIKKVVFQNKQYMQLARDMEANEMVSYLEAKKLDSLIQKEFRLIDSLNTTKKNSTANKAKANQKAQYISSTLNKLQGLPFQEVSGNFNYFSTTVYEMAEDGVLDENEKNTLRKLRLKRDSAEVIVQSKNERLSEASYWMDRPYQYLTDYNNAITQLIKSRLISDRITKSTIHKSTFNSAYLKEHWVVNYSHIGDSVAVMMGDPHSVDKFLKEQLYPFGYQDVKITISKLDKTSLPYDSTGVWIYDKNNDTTINKINLKWKELFHPEFREDYFHQNFIHIGNNLFFIRKIRNLNLLISNDNNFLTPEQVLETETYVRSEIQQKINEIEQSPLERANRWIKSKLASR